MEIIMKKIVLGLIIGLFLSSGVVFAATELNVVPNPFPVFFNGESKDVKWYSIDGDIYVKLTDLNDFGLIANFNEKNEQIEIVNANSILLPYFNNYYKKWNTLDETLKNGYYSLEKLYK